MLRNVWLVVIIASLVFLAACNNEPAETVEAVVEDQCLVGIWEVSNLETYMHAAIPPGAFEVGQLKLLKVAGSVAYNFQENGLLDILAVSVKSNFNAATELGDLSLEIRIDGAARGKYSLEGEIIIVEPVIDSRMNYLAILDGERMMETTKVEEFGPLFVPPYNSGRYECSQDTLSVQILNLPGGLGSIIFERTE